MLVQVYLILLGTSHILLSLLELLKITLLGMLVPCILQTLILTLLKVVLMTTLGLQAATVLRSVPTGVTLFMGTQILSTLYPLKHSGSSSSNPVLTQVYLISQVPLVCKVLNTRGLEEVSTHLALAMDGILGTLRILRIMPLGLKQVEVIPFMVPQKQLHP